MNGLLLLGILGATGTEPPEPVKRAVADIIGNNFKVSTSAPKRDTVPAVAFNPISSEWFVVWEHWFKAQPIDRDIRARRISATGVLLGSEIVIVQLTKDETNPRVAYSPTSQRYMVTWVEEDKDVKAKVIDNLGNQTVAPFYVDLFVSGRSIEPAIVWRKALDDFFIAWSETVTGPGNHDLFGSLINPDGTIKRDNIFLRDVNTVDLRRPALAYNEERDEYYLAYDNASDVFGFRIDGAVVFQLSDIATISNAPGVQIRAAIAFNSIDKEYLVAWEDDRNGQNDIFARKVTELGLVLGSAVALRASANAEEFCALAYKADANAYVVAWEEQTSNGDWDIQARGVGADLTLGAIDRVSRPTADPNTETSNEFSVAVALNTTTGEYLLAWQDGRSGVFDIWAQRATYAAPGAPNVPTNLGHSDQTTTSITWTWQDNSADETGFDVETADHLEVASVGPNVITTIEPGLLENTQYTRHVHAENAAGSSEPSVEASAYTSIHDPVLADFTLTVVSDSRIDVSVTPPPNSSQAQTGCEIQRSLDQSAWVTVKGFSSVYSASDTGLLANTTYYYRFRYRNGDGDPTPDSPTKNATTGTDATPPAAPTGLAAIGGVGKIDLSWNPNSEPDFASYKVLRSATAGGPYTEIASGITQTTYSNTGLGAGETWYYVVRAVDTSNNVSANSNEASATTGSGNPPAAPVISTPAKKTNDVTPVISGSAEANSTVEVWFGAASYGTTTASATGAWTVHNTLNPQADGVHSVTAKATNAFGTSPASAAVSITIDTVPPAAPTNLALTPRDGAIELSWSASPDADLLGYNIYRKAPGEGVFTRINLQVVVGTQYRDTGLQNGQVYSYKVTAVDDALNEAH